MANSNKLYESMNNLWEDFQENHRSFSEKGNKAAGTRARKALAEIGKAVKSRRKEIQEAKNAAKASA